MRLGEFAIWILYGADAVFVQSIAAKVLLYTSVGILFHHYPKRILVFLLIVKKNREIITIFHLFPEALGN